MIFTSTKGSQLGFSHRTSELPGNQLRFAFCFPFTFLQRPRPLLSERRGTLFFIRRRKRKKIKCLCHSSTLSTASSRTTPPIHYRLPLWTLLVFLIKEGNKKRIAFSKTSSHQVWLWKEVFRHSGVRPRKVAS